MQDWIQDDPIGVILEISCEPVGNPTDQQMHYDVITWRAIPCLGSSPGIRRAGYIQRTTNQQVLTQIPGQH